MPTPREKQIIRTSVIALILILFGLLFTRDVEGQWRIDNPELYPITIAVPCGDCDPTDSVAAVSLVLRGAVKNWNNCITYGRNEWLREASAEECGRGQVKVYNDFGDIGFYYHRNINPEKRTGEYFLLFYTPANTFKWGGCYHLSVCRSDKYFDEDSFDIP